MKTNFRAYIRSSSFFMALLFTVLCGAVAISLGVFINYFAKGHFVNNTQAVFESEIKYLNTLGKLPKNTDNSRLYIPLSSHEIAKNTIASEFTIAKGLTEGLLLLSKDNIQYTAKIYTLNSGQKVLIGTNITDIANNYIFMQWVGVASILFVMMVVFISYVISVFVVKGTNKIAATANDIIHTGDLSQRVDVKSRWDDLSNVAIVLNLLFDRIEQLMHGVRQVSDNIAHDLRTPLSRMRNRIADAQKKGASDQDFADILQECDNLLDTFGALLRISRIETEQQRQHFDTVYINTILSDVVDFYAPYADDKKIHISITEMPDIPIYGDKNLLFQAFANITDNAIKYTPNGGSIVISVTPINNDTTKISVTNSTDPLPPESLSKIFDRFYRTDSSRHTVGTGLGLSLVQAVISLHGGKVSAHNTKHGLQIITIL